MPVDFLIEVYSSKAVFFISPCFVTNTTYCASVSRSKLVAAITFSLLSIWINVAICCPFEAFVPIGSLSTNILYIFPTLVNTNKLSIVLVFIIDRIASSSVLTPTPFLLCVLKLVLGILLTSPVWVKTTTTSSGITVTISLSSFEISIWANSVLLSSPYFLTSSANLSFIICCFAVIEDNILLNSAIFFTNSFFSSFNSIFSNLAKLPNLIATIDLAWASVNLYSFTKPSLAAALDSDFLIKAIILSISSNAFNNPSTISKRASAAFKSNSISFVKHSILCFTYISIQSFKFNSVGVLLIKATWLYEKLFCKLVFKNNLLAIESKLVSFLHSTTILKPFLLLSFLILTISGISSSAIVPISAIKFSVEVP